MTNYKALKFNIKKMHVLQVKKTPFNFNIKNRTAFLTNDISFNIGHDIILTTSNIESRKIRKQEYVSEIDTDFYNKISDGDIIEVLDDGTINVLWEKNLTPNDITLFITNQCNANCIMCPQPPKKDDYSLLNMNMSILNNLKNESIKKIGITGGEPTLKENDLLLLLKKSYELYPLAKIDILTNAKKLSNFNYAKNLAISNPNIKFCISFPSDNENDFNEILKSNIYNDAIFAIQNLALLRQEIELRIVIVNQNYKRLLNISEFIYRNFPFVSHIAFMGMEVIGHAYDNYESIKVSPSEFSDNLLDAVRFLNQRQMNVSIYNLPYCLLDSGLWRFLRNSISNWKQNFEIECNLCTKKNSCSGIFSTTQVKNYTLKSITS